MALSESVDDGYNSKLFHLSKDCAEPSEETPSGIGLDIDEEIVHGMTVSYTEISFNTQSSEPDDSVLEDLHDSIHEVERLHEGSKSTEDAAERPSKLQLCNGGSEPLHPVSQTQSTNRAVEFLNHLNGTVTQEGPMVSYVAEDLETKIKLSSPVTKSDDLNGWGSGMPWLYRQVLTSQITSVDLSILTDLEIEVGKIATSVDSLTENLAGILHSMSALTVECLETYRDVVCKTCDAVDLNIKSMYQLMAKCEELSKSMTPIYKLSEHIKEIKHFLDVFENTMS